MKMKYLLGILAVAAIGAGTYFAIKSNKKKTDCDKVFDAKAAKKNEEFEKKDSTVEKEIVQGSFEAMQETIVTTEADKSAAVETIATRHKEAAEVMKESISKIVDDPDIENIASENEKELDKIDNALDKLLDE